MLYKGLPLPVLTRILGPFSSSSFNWVRSKTWALLLCIHLDGPWYDIYLSQAILDPRTCLLRNSEITTFIHHSGTFRCNYMFGTTVFSRCLNAGVGITRTTFCNYYLQYICLCFRKVFMDGKLTAFVLSRLHRRPVKVSLWNTSFFFIFQEKQRNWSVALEFCLSRDLI